MALLVKDRVKETTATAGTGTITLAGAVAQFQSFAVIGDTTGTYYAVEDGGGVNWEVGVGTYLSAGTTLSRDTVLASSAGGRITLSGTSTVFCTYPADKAVYNNLNNQTVVGNSGIVFNDSTIQSTAGLVSGDNISQLLNDSGYLNTHPTISAAASSDNSGRTYIQDLLFDSNGHVTGVTTATETAGSGTTYTAGTGITLQSTVFHTFQTGVFDAVHINPVNSGEVALKIAATPNDGTNSVEVSGKSHFRSHYMTVAEPTGDTVITLDLDQSNFFNVTMDKDKTLAVSGEDVGQTFILNIRQNSGVLPGSGYDVTWWNGIYWADTLSPNTPPLLSDSGDLVDTVGFIVPSGNKFYGYLVGTGIYDPL